MELVGVGIKHRDWNDNTILLELYGMELEAWSVFIMMG